MSGSGNPDGVRTVGPGPARGRSGPERRTLAKPGRALNAPPCGAAIGPLASQSPSRARKWNRREQRSGTHGTSGRPARAPVLGDRQVDRGPAAGDRRAPAHALRRRSRAARGGAGPGQDPADLVGGARLQPRVQADPVHARPHAVSDVTGTEVLEEDQSTGNACFQFIRGPIFANIVPGRRDQPHAAEDPGRPAGGDAGAAA